MLLQLVFASNAMAGETAAGWQPRAVKHDWLQLTSGEWLSGKIHSMYSEELEFDSEKLDLLSIDWEDVKSLQSHQFFHVLVAGPDDQKPKKDTKSGGIFTGRLTHKLTGNLREKTGANADMQTGLLHISGERVTVTNGEQVATFNRDDIISFAPAGQREVDLWVVKIGLGLNFQSGNVRQIDYTAKASAKRRTATTRFFADYIGNLSQTNTISGSSEKTINNHRVTSALDVYANRYFFYTPINAEYYRDPFRNIDQRITVGAGLGFILRDTKKLKWEVSAGPSFLRTTYLSVQPGRNSTESSLALMLGTKVDAELSSKLDFLFNYDIKASKNKSGGYSHHMIATFENEMTRRIDLDVSLMWDRINHPTVDSQGILPKPDDYRVVMGLKYAFD
ncbi:MAG: DUF481 domain-containing protein [Mariprofundus sp.]